MKRSVFLALSGLLASGVALAQPAAPTVPQTPVENRHAGEMVPFMVTSSPPLHMALALDAARAALDACRAHKAGVVVAIFDRNGELRVLLSGDGPMAFDAQKQMQRNADAVLQSGIPSGGALPIMGGKTSRGVISVAGAYDVTKDRDDPARDLMCAQVGLDKIKDRL
jgi:hypothetical protein